VTGGGSGLGRATAERLAALGAKVAILDVNGDAVRAVAAEIGGLGIACDVTSPDGAAAAVAEARARHGAARILVNCAGIGPARRIVGRDGPQPLDDFAKVDLRVAEVVAAEKLPKSRKLLKLTVKVGDETRTLVAGVAEHYDPADLVGRRVVIVANLMPATLMGVESNGMVLAASHEGTVSLLTPDKEVPPGARVK